jgi:hypothetical protein
MPNAIISACLASGCDQALGIARECVELGMEVDPALRERLRSV